MALQIVPYVILSALVLMQVFTSLIASAFEDRQWRKGKFGEKPVPFSSRDIAELAGRKACYFFLTLLNLLGIGILFLIALKFFHL